MRIARRARISWRSRIRILRGKYREQEGFTLLEGMAAAAVLALGILAVIGMQTTAMTSGVRGNNRTLATTLAESRMEEIRMWCQHPLVTVGTPEGLVGCLLNQPTTWQFEELDETGQVLNVPIGEGKFTRAYEIQILGSARRQATVQVSWGQGRTAGNVSSAGPIGRVLITSLIYQYPP